MQDHVRGFSAWLFAFLLTLAVELPLVAWLGRRAEPRAPHRVAVALLANTLSHPAVWFGFPRLGLAWLATTALSETWAWLLETCAYRVAFPRASWRSAALLSLAANLLSFGLGLALFATGVLG